MSDQNPAGSQQYHITVQDSRYFAIGDGARVEQPPAGEPPPPPVISFSLLSPTFPTAYSHHLDARAFPFVTFTLDNRHAHQPATVQVSAVITGLSDTASATAVIEAGQRVQVSLLPLLPRPAAASLNEIRPATLRLTAQQTAPRPGRLLDQTERIHLLARDSALLAMQPAGHLTDLTPYLAAWVTPRIPPVEQLLRQAVAYHPRGEFAGYQGAADPAAAPLLVRQQVQAIFRALKEQAHLAYINAPLSLGAAAGQIMQRVRLPSQSLSTPGSANCLDGSVLLASLLELAALEPLILLVPGHALAGWRTRPGQEPLEFLETTLIGRRDFDLAWQRGQATYARARQAGYFERDLFDPAGFARLIDVAACRRQGIYPLE